MLVRVGPNILAITDPGMILVSYNIPDSVWGEVIRTMAQERKWTTPR